jgi:hypothetical protein
VRNAAFYPVNSPGGWNDATGPWNKLIAPSDQIFPVTTYNSVKKYAGQNGTSTFDRPPVFSDFSLAMPVQILKAHAQADVVSPKVLFSSARLSSVPVV